MLTLDHGISQLNRIVIQEIFKDYRLFSVQALVLGRGWVSLFATCQLIGELLESTFCLDRRALLRIFKLLVSLRRTSLFDRVKLCLVESATSDIEQRSSQTLEWDRYRLDVKGLNRAEY